ncbi:MAG TPA: FHA domain-containing protein [Terriglobia bacterium]|jgi:hypothetical protein|nr:FHA domain-containing protein [Terriglobia bacterium]
MALPIEQIDTSLIEELMGLKRDGETLRARLARMAGEADKVSAPVFQRVHADYQARLAALDERAAPKKQQARREFAKLRRLLDEVGARRDAVLQDQEELEFRHRLGEFEAADFTARGADLAQRIAGVDQELAGVTAVRERFVAAFDSEADLATDPETAAGGTPDAVPRLPTEPVELVEAAVPNVVPPPPGMGFGTVILPRVPHVPNPANNANNANISDLAKPDDTVPPAGATMIAAFGRLVRLDEGTGAAAEIRVEHLAAIGRTRQNHIQIDAPSVSRKHAQIALTDHGYVLRDLGSENGTFVNGERIAEQPLKDGDHLQFGSVGFLFHTR